jgi:hypothetical protein
MWFDIQASRFGGNACPHHQRGILSSTENEPFKLGVREMKVEPEAASEKTQNGGVRNCHKRLASPNYSANRLNLCNEKFQIMHQAS